jgi:hypothetical protein
LTFKRVIITFFAILGAVSSLSLNFIDVSSGRAAREVSLDIEAGRDKELEAQETEISVYSQVSPEIAYLRRPASPDALISPRDTEMESPTPESAIPSGGPDDSKQGTTFDLRNLQIIVQGDTIRLETPQSAAHAHVMDHPIMIIQNNNPMLLEPLSTRKDFLLDEQTPQQLQAGVLEQEGSQAKPDLSVPVIQIQYDPRGNYDARKTWDGVDVVDLLARAMLTEENEKLFDSDRVIDLVGTGWVMINRTQKSDGYFNYAEENLYGALVPYFQFALGGVKSVNGRILPGNAAIVANPELYPAWFGGDPQASYWKAYQIAFGILNGSVPDPTEGALYFADFYINEEGLAVPFEDGRTRFWFRGYRSYTIPELQQLDSIPWSSN